MWHTWGVERCMTFWLENPKGKDHTEDLSVDVRIMSEWILEKEGGNVWTGFICFRIGTSDRLLRTQ
jgi:hypothetical protein